MIVLVLAQVPTIITVIIGILLHAKKVTNLDSLMTSFESTMTRIENRLTRIEQKLDSR